MAPEVPTNLSSLSPPPPPKPGRESDPEKPHLLSGGSLAVLGLVVLALIGVGLSLLYALNWRSKEADQGINSQWKDAQKRNQEREFDRAKGHRKQFLEITPFGAAGHFWLARVSRRSQDFR